MVDRVCRALIPNNSGKCQNMLSSTQQATPVPVMRANTCSWQSSRTSKAIQRNADPDVEEELRETEDESDLDVVTTSGNEETLSQTGKMFSLKSATVNRTWILRR